jgi:hypothetical protein
MSIEEREWQAVIDQYARMLAGNQEGIELIKHLVHIGQITKATIVRYMVLKLYPATLAENKNHMAAIVDLAVTLNVCERTVWGILSKQGIRKRY